MATSTTEWLDPTRHRLYAVELKYWFKMYLVAERPEEATVLAPTFARDEIQEIQPEAIRVQEVTALKGVPEADYSYRPYGDPTVLDLTLAEVFEIIEAGRPRYDTETLLMPFAETPPPLRKEE